MPQGLLADVYMDIATSKTGLFRKEFNCMIEDYQSHKLDILGIIKKLEKRKIPLPTGKKKWCKRMLDVMQSNR